jgi:hypothetical protein
LSWLEEESTDAVEEADTLDASRARQPAKNIPCRSTEITKPITLLVFSRFALISDWFLKSDVILNHRLMFILKD